ncbi:MAG: AbrB/MazE/SpoVT family DNA-binding domain-containing protein [Armatimonadetes bacterium]|nr:AbrB/MazE/SpoVT family DNA-binding domain-containing protein [Armatimonadota bacterium]
MKTTVDKFGRVVIPKKIRDRIGLSQGSALSIEERDEEIILRPLAELSPVEVIDGVLVFTGKAVGDMENEIRRHREQRLRGPCQPTDFTGSCIEARP